MAFPAAPPYFLMVIGHRRFSSMICRPISGSPKLLSGICAASSISESSDIKSECSSCSCSSSERFALSQNHSPAEGSGASRLGRAINQITNVRQVSKRSMASPSEADPDELSSSSRRLDLMAKYINQSYSETKEDREFVQAMSRLDEDPTSSDLKRQVAQVSADIRQSSRQAQMNAKLMLDLSKGEKNLNESDKLSKNTSLVSELINKASNSLMSLTTSSPKSTESININDLINDQDPEDDYEDKIKAIRYIFFNEIPRKSFAGSSLVENQERLETILNLVVVIKDYFPFPDAASVQFMDGIHNYLLKQQQNLLNLSQKSPQQQANAVGFDTKGLKMEVKRLESEGKRLPDYPEWKHCSFGGYSCALWRLFHTLTAFEYVKLIQINQHSTSPSQQVVKQLPPQILPSEQQRADQLLQPTAASLSSALGDQEQQKNINSPVERLVAPPSTTTSLSLTIVNPSSSILNGGPDGSQNSNSTSSKRQQELDALPNPVLLVMRDYVTQFFSCVECARKFRLETADLSFDRIRQQEPAEFSIMWLWETHNRVSKRLSIDPSTNPAQHPKKWFPTYNQCQKCYKRPPSYLKETNLELAAIFHESIEWNREEVLSYLLCQYTRQPMNNLANIFGYQVPHGVAVIITCFLLLIILLRCASYYVERQKRYKASLLNGNGYSMELQRNM